MQDPRARVSRVDRVSRVALPRTAARLSAELARVLRVERTKAGWPQRRLAAAIGISQSRVSRHETLAEPRPRVDVYARAFDALGVTLHIEVYRRAEARQRDRAHAFVLAYILRRLPPHWLVDTEVSVRRAGRSGWIDLLLFDPSTRMLVVVEIKTEIHDLGEILRTLRWHTEQARAAALARSWRPMIVIPALVVLATRESVDRLIGANRLIAVALPGDGRQLLTVLTAKAPSTNVDIPRGFVGLVDPQSRRAQWIQLIPHHGPRPQARWADYADFMRSIEGRRLPRPREACPQGRTPPLRASFRA